MIFVLPDLPYAKDALSPCISAKTFDFHHGKHPRSRECVHWEGPAAEVQCKTTRPILNQIHLRVCCPRK